MPPICEDCWTLRLLCETIRLNLKIFLAQIRKYSEQLSKNKISGKIQENLAVSRVWRGKTNPQIINIHYCICFMFGWFINTMASQSKRCGQVWMFPKYSLVSLISFFIEYNHLRYIMIWTKIKIHAPGIYIHMCI